MQSQENPVKVKEKVKGTQLDAKTLKRLEWLVQEINNSDDYFRMQDGQSQELTFNINDIADLRTRTIHTEDGEKTVIKVVFSVWNPKIQHDQLFEISRKWARRIIAAITFNNTTTLIARRTGVGLKTDYTFQPAELSA
jgi:hypothetical protein